MPNIYIDESGSITQTNVALNRYFVIALLEVKDSKVVRKRYSQFITRNLKRMKSLDKSDAIFDAHGKFKELKGNCFDAELKRKFLKHFCQNNLLYVSYIIVDNAKLSSVFCENKSRAFNFLLKSYFTWRFNNGAAQERYELQIDERNVKTGAKYNLEDYLNTELRLQYNFNVAMTVRYFDSVQNKLIQLADVFSNIFYSSLRTKAFDTELKTLMHTGYINPLFVFPTSYLQSEEFTKNKTEDII